MGESDGCALPVDGEKDSVGGLLAEVFDGAEEGA